ncbi:MAG: efflux transporter outer membrane subunit [Burkholderiaceae bacterium]|jgi:multidrug efflux system outer membrane protein|nr:efflux transporter outer membrane subunit [Burkholderiaceae bacterium]
MTPAPLAATRLATAGLAVIVLLAGCAVGDDYTRPALELPGAHRGIETPGTSLAARDWREVFTDSALRPLIDEALNSNLDLRLAEARVREAQAAVVIARSGMLPNLSVGLQTSPTARLPGDTFTSSYLAAGFLSWEIDLWGRIRRGTEAARADLATREAARYGVQVSLVAQTASSYFTLAALRDSQEATERSVQLQRDSLRLMRRRNQAGIVSAAEVRQAEGQLAGTEALLPEVARQINATENGLALLLARPPSPFATGKTVLELPATLPTGLPTELLERRPDLRQAEQQLVAANARVGEAKALLLPSLSITGTFGRLSTELGDLLASGSTQVASLGPNVVQPLYAGGSLMANRDVALARLDAALIGYRAAALNALREVADAVETYRRAAEAFEKQQVRVTAQREALRLADKRFAAGVVSFLEVLDAQRQLLAAETDVVNARLAQQLAYVQLYRALGGGWSVSAGAS